MNNNEKSTSSKYSKKQDDTTTEIDLAQGQASVKPKKLNAKREINGPKGLEPTRYGDWESKGRCYDF